MYKTFAYEQGNEEKGMSFYMIKINKDIPFSEHSLIQDVKKKKLVTCYASEQECGVLQETYPFTWKTVGEKDFRNAIENEGFKDFSFNKTVSVLYGELMEKEAQIQSLKEENKRLLEKIAALEAVEVLPPESEE